MPDLRSRSQDKQRHLLVLKHYVYALWHEDEEKPRYVGMTSRPKHRLWEHKNDSQSSVDEDKKRFLADLKVSFVVLEECVGPNRELEAKWVAKYHPIYNLRPPVVTKWYALGYQSFLAMMKNYGSYCRREHAPKIGRQTLTFCY